MGEFHNSMINGRSWHVGHQLKVWVRQMVEIPVLKELDAKLTYSGVEGLEAATMDLSKHFSSKQAF